MARGRLFEFRPGQYKAKPVRNGLITLGLLFFAIGYMYTDGAIVPLPKGGKIVKAEFPSAANVSLATTPVRVKGVDVGEIDKVERMDNGEGAVVSMRIEDGHDFELKRDASAHIYWRTLLGYQFYVELDPGSAAEPLGGATIPLKSNTTQVELDEVLAAATPKGREGMKALFQEFDEGFSKPSEPGRVIDSLGPSMRQVAPGLRALQGRRTGDLSDTVSSTSRLMGTLARSEAELGQLIGNARTSLGVTAARRSDLGETLSDAPATLDETIASMSRLRTTLSVLDPVAADLRPGARRLDETSRELEPAMEQLEVVLDDARPLLDDLDPALKRLRRASDQGVPLLEALDPTLVRARDTLLPWLDKTDSGTKIKNFQAIGPVFASISSSASQFDVNGHAQTFNAAAGGGRSLSVLPCTLEFPKDIGIDCADVGNVFKGIFGAPFDPKAKPLSVKKPRSGGKR